MLKMFCSILAAFIASEGAAQSSRRPDPADANAAVPARPYESAFRGYRPYVDQEPGRWRESNDEMGRLGGHVGHVPQRPGASAKPSAKPPAQAGHGDHK